MKHRLFLSGPITNIDDYRKRFDQDDNLLTSKGWAVANPTRMGLEIFPDTEDGWKDCMKETISIMIKCNGVALMDGWEKSRGSKIEKEIADILGIPTKTVIDWAKQDE
ncbi:MAG: DUF4406 domain-containing protein [Elusimicrobiota bacterium]|jgi:hypothetical protein|nr:DUF4406 domain-containing protein [Elusimicrobiota bacterium]